VSGVDAFEVVSAHSCGKVWRVDLDFLRGLCQIWASQRNGGAARLICVVLMLRVPVVYVEGKAFKMLLVCCF
jgi:hypothetical protein